MGKQIKISSPGSKCLLSLFLVLLLQFTMNVVLSFTEAIAAEHEIKFVEARVGTAILRIDQKTYFLKPGKRTPHGIEVVSMTKDEAIIRVNDTQYRYAKGSNKGELVEVKLYRPKRYGNHFIARGTINNKPVEFFIDTGATTILLSKKHAQSLGIPTSRVSNPITVETASKSIIGDFVMLDSVGVGDILIEDVSAIVAKEYTDKFVILGMSFLNKVNFSVDGDCMIFKPK